MALGGQRVCDGQTPRRLQGVVLIVAMFGAAGCAGLRYARPTAEKLVEVRPPGAVNHQAEATIAEELAEIVRRVDGVAHVHKVAYSSRGDGSEAGPLVVIGYEPPASPLPDFLTVPVVAGRALRGDDSGRSVAVVGKLVTEEGSPPRDAVAVGPARIEVVGVFSSGIPVNDQQILLPLATFQRLFGLEGRVSTLFVTVKKPADAKAVEAVMEALREALGDGVDVVHAYRHFK